MEHLAVSDRDGAAAYSPKGASRSNSDSGEFLEIYRAANGAPGAANSPVRDKHDPSSMNQMFGSNDPNDNIKESPAPRDDARDDNGAEDNLAGREDPRPRESAAAGHEDSRDADANAAARGHDDSGADTADRSETDAKMSKNAEKSDSSGKDSDNTGGQKQSGGESKDGDAETAAAAAAAASAKVQTAAGAAELAAGQAQRGAQTQTAEGQSQTAAQNAAQAAQAQAKGAGADSGAGQDRKQAQEQDIAAKLKPGQAVKVEVKTADEAKTLISKPASALLSEGADDGAAQAQRAGGSGAQNGLSIAQQAQQAQAQNANQNANQTAGPAQQVQVQTAAVQSAAKGLSVSGPQAAGPAGGAAAGGESAAQNTAQAAQPRSETPQQTEQARQNANAHNTHQTRARVVEQISVQIAKAAAGGNDRIQITLKPAELGRVEIQIEMTHDGRAAAVVTADNKETLEMLRRDAGELAKALQDAGLKTGAGDLSFNLRGENAQADAGDGKAEGGLFDGDGEEDGEADMADGEDALLPEDARIPQPVGVRGLAGVNLTA